MIDQHYIDIFEKFLRNEISEEEIDELQAIMYINKDIQRYFEDRLAETEHAIHPHLQQKVFRAIIQDIEQKTKRSFLLSYRKKILQWAAILLLPLISGITVYYFMSEDGRHATPTVFTTQKGEKAEAILPDGSKVWINSASTLRYDDRFNRNERVVYLEGEGYFEVKPDADCPFTVKTPSIDIQALGTSFNVRSYEADQEASAVLLEGKIRVVASGQEKMLQVNQRILFDKKTQQFITDRVQASHFIEWKKGSLYFHNQTYYDIAATLSRIYNVNIRVASEELRPMRFTGTLGSNGIKNALDILSLTSPMRYDVKDTVIILYHKGG